MVWTGKQFVTPLGGLGIPFIIRVNHALSGNNFGMSEMMEAVYGSQFLTKSIILGQLKINDCWLVPTTAVDIELKRDLAPDFRRLFCGLVSM